MSNGDTIRALAHPYRQEILAVLESGRTTYSDLFDRLEPRGGERGRFNYHLRSLRSGDLVRITDGLYRLSPRGEAALVFLKEVSDHRDLRYQPKQTARRQLGKAVRVGDTLRSPMRSVTAFRHRTIGRAGALTPLGTISIVAAIVWFFLAVATSFGGFGSFYSSPFPIALRLMFYGLIGGPILALAGGILLTVSQRRHTPGEWVGLAFIVSGLGWGFFVPGYVIWTWSSLAAVPGLVASLVLICAGVGIFAWEQRYMPRAGVS